MPKARTPNSPSLSRGGSAPISNRFAIALIIAVAIATRMVAWWNPVAHVDDQFYLLAGEQLLKGHWPYVDLWDRKPLGLFLLYAGIAWIGGGTILGLNLVATAFAAGTAWAIRQIGLRFASPTGATLAALSYLLVIPLLGGQTGQSPVFYNLMIAGAGWLLIASGDKLSLSTVRSHAFLAMFLCGLAMTIKQISFVEGGFFGLAFLWLAHRRGASFGWLGGTALAMVAIALLPTALSVLGYALAGPGPLNAYVDASYASIFRKGGWELTAKLAGLTYFGLFLGPLLLMALAGAYDRRKARPLSVPDRLLIGWMAAAIAGYFAIPHFFDHYTLPVVVPLAISAATLFDRPSGKLFFAALAIFCVMQPPIRDWSKTQRSRAEFARVVEAVNVARQGGCIYIGDGPTRLYSVTGACTVTRYLFPDHLNLIIESRAVGVDTGAELSRILAARPAAIVTMGRNPRRYSPTYRQFLAEVKQGYRLTYVGSMDAPQFVQRVLVWQRKDLPSPRS